MPIVLKSGSLNLLEPSGPPQACNGAALPIYTTIFLFDVIQKRTTEVKYVKYEILIVALTKVAAVWDLVRH